MELIEGVIPEQPAEGTAIMSHGLEIDNKGNLTIDKPGKYEIGRIYVPGNLIITSLIWEIVKVELKGTVWVHGTLQINGDAIVYRTYDAGDIPLGMSDANIDYLYSKYEDGDSYFMITDKFGSGSNKVFNSNGNTPAGVDYKIEAILYATNWPISLIVNANVKGGAVSTMFVISGSSCLNFPLPFREIPPEYPDIDLIYWKIAKYLFINIITGSSHLDECCQ